jgi:hypothetical protein
MFILENEPPTLETISEHRNTDYSDFSPLFSAVRALSSFLYTFACSA